ncbi:transporter substrate-binding domain-containing protein [Pseudomonas sp. JS3066]|jgi:polar amino acid transport system substrate-binding protein|uniref:substrate-binding periplasmic protein n=1 Tax=unclassified Pseudomonas TaxID=196821 RepID=UPI000EAA0EEE|nr:MULTISPECIES: transporter substrate-binding domain-containing protein [unclassified Pseudomonas]AYF88996.1 ABC transporter substrate-binding protein [Pseudomonas sp. DY-1]MDH4653191.1 transporter substrate-binding domain-containing protein [Pseudomonas sp. BN606]MRK21087.1 transporter substrate-binding domain-containing protein [Pseudomonas sp. JG-B]WVK93465.1 transporter substrate-binding domain-containing protein [Pseudomonas sp. JS3066]
MRPRFRTLCVILWVLGLIPFADGRELLAVGTEFPGIYVLDAKGAPSGLGIDVMRAIASDLGDQVRFESYPWARAQKLVEEGRADVLIGPYRTAARELRFQFAEPGFYRDSVVFYARSETSSAWDGTLASLKGQRIAIIHGWIYGERFEAMRGQLDLHVTPSVELAFRLLMAGRADLAASNERDSRPRIVELGISGKVRKLTPVIDTQVGYFALPRGESHRQLRDDIGRVLKQMRADGRLKDLARPYGVPLP